MNLIESYRVSSVLNRNVKEYGKKYLFDGDVETCWNSEAHTNQFIIINLVDNRLLKSFAIQFQGGFAGKNCSVEAIADSAVAETCEFFPRDINKIQTFVFDFKSNYKSYKINFHDSSDLFGRIIIYDLKLDLE